MENVQGSTRVADAFQELLENFNIPEVKDAIGETLQFIKSLISTKYADKLDIVLNKVIKLTKKFVLTSVKQFATKFLAEKLRETVRLISEESLRQEFLANNFSAIHMQMVKSFANLIVGTAEKKSEYFKMMMLGENEKLSGELFVLCKTNFKHSWEKLNINKDVFDREYLPRILTGFNQEFLKEFILSSDFKKNYSHLRTLMVTPDDNSAFSPVSDMLLEMIKKNCKWNSPISDQISQNFIVYLKPLIDTIVNELNEKQKAAQRLKKEASLSDKDIETILVNYLKGENDNNWQYAELLSSVIKMGNLNFKNFIIQAFNFGMVKTKLTKVLLPAMHPIRTSIRGITDLVVAGLDRKLNDNYVEILLIQKHLIY